MNLDQMTGKLKKKTMHGLNAQLILISPVASVRWLCHTSYNYCTIYPYAPNELNFALGKLPQTKA